MKKVALILALCTLPLAIATGLNLFLSSSQAGSGDGGRFLTDGEIEGADKHSHDGLTAAGAAATGAAGLTELNPVSASPLPELKLDNAPGLQQIPPGWDQVRVASDGLHNFLKLSADPSAEQKKLDEFLQGEPFAKLEDSTAKRDLLSKLEGRKKHLSEQEKSKKALAEGKAFFDGKGGKRPDFASALKELAKVDPQTLSSQERDLFATLQADAAFRDYWDGLRHRPAGETTKAKLQNLRKKLADSAAPQPRDGTVRDEEGFKYLEAMNLEVKRLEGQDKLETFLKKKPATLTDMLAGCTEILNETPEASGALRLALRQWLAERLAAKQPTPKDLALQISISKLNSKNIRGTFQTLPDPDEFRYTSLKPNAKPQTFKKDNAVLRNEAPFWNFLLRSDLQKYDEAVAAALDSISPPKAGEELTTDAVEAKRLWEDLEATCEDLQTELKARDPGFPEYKDWEAPANRAGYTLITFNKEAAVANEVLAHWEQIVELLTADGS